MNRPTLAIAIACVIATGIFYETVLSILPSFSSSGGVSTALPAEPSKPSRPLPPDASAPCKPLSTAPATLFEPGRYCLTQDLVVTNGDGIIVKTEFVTVDLNGHTITGPVEDADGTIGVTAHGVSNFRLTNGSVRGFGTAISMISTIEDRNSGYNQIDHVKVSKATQRGVLAVGRFTRIFESEFARIGGGKHLPTVHTHGVIVVGPGAIIRNNKFSEIRGSMEKPYKAEGIALAFSGHINGALAENNEFVNLHNTAYGERGDASGFSNSTYAIWFGGDGMGNVVAHNNRIENYVNGIVFDTHVSGVVSDNSALNTAVPVAVRSESSVEDSPLAAGADGFTPSDADGQRPRGHVYHEDNECKQTSKNIVQATELAIELEDCVSAQDISYERLTSYYPQTGDVAKVPVVTD